MTNTHTELCRQILITYGQNKNWKLWLNNIGAVKTETRFVRFGLPGSTDILGFDKSGRFIAIEVKTGTGVLRENQENFKKICLAYNVQYLEARCLFDADLFFKKITEHLIENPVCLS